MDTFNRVILAILFALVAIASVAGILATNGVVAFQQIQTLAFFQQASGFISRNLLPVALGAILTLVIVALIGALWLRGQFLGTARAIAGGAYEPESTTGPGVAEVDYSVISKAIDSVNGSISGVAQSRTRIYSDKGELFARTSLKINRGVDFHRVDNEMRRMIDHVWMHHMGTGFVRHDAFINIEQTERRVA